MNGYGQACLLFCQGKKRNRSPCTRFAGEGTRHLGFGFCAGHGGRSKRVESAWRMARLISSEHPEIPLWDSLQWGASHAHARALMLEQLFNEEVQRSDGAQLSDYMFKLLAESRNELKLEAQLVASAINAGIAVQEQKNNAVNGQLVALAIVAGLDKLALSAEERTAALVEAHKKLLAIEASGNDTS